MFSRRGFIRVGAASVGTLALRPFGLLPTLAQTGPDYRALVCVFLFGGNDSNNTIVPLDDASYKSYLSIRASLGLPLSAMQQVESVSGAPYGFHTLLSEVASLFSSKELAVVANMGSLVQPVTRAQYQAQQTPVPSNLFSHADQQQQWQTSVGQGNSATGWAGRAADYVAAQGMNSSKFPTFLSVAGNALEGTGAKTQPVAIAPGGTLQLAGFNGSAASQARYTALTDLLNLASGVSLVQAANSTLANSIADATALHNALAKATALKTQFPKNNTLGAQLQQVAQIIQVHADLGMNRQIFFCSLGGFDTHTGELGTQNTLYPQVSQALAAFYDATQELGVAQHVTTFTESDLTGPSSPPRAMAATTRGAVTTWYWAEPSRAARSSAGSPPSSWAGRTTPMCAAAGFPRRRLTSMARHCAPGLGFRTRRCPPFFRTCRTFRWPSWGSWASSEASVQATVSGGFAARNCGSGLLSKSNPIPKLLMALAKRRPEFGVANLTLILHLAR